MHALRNVRLGGIRKSGGSDPFARGGLELPSMVNPVHRDCCPASTEHDSSNPVSAEIGHKLRPRFVAHYGPFAPHDRATGAWQNLCGLPLARQPATRKSATPPVVNSFFASGVSFSPEGVGWAIFTAESGVNPTVSHFTKPSTPALLNLFSGKMGAVPTCAQLLGLAHCAEPVALHPLRVPGFVCAIYQNALDASCPRPWPARSSRRKRWTHRAEWGPVLPMNSGREPSLRRA